jgi:hypothetical protein
MVLSRFQAAASSVVLALMAGCSAQSSIKPAEFLDERTGMTVGALGKPIELFHSAQRMATSGERISFAYLGPVEWDNMGNISYGLWIHLAPGSDWRFDDIRTAGAVTLSLDDGAAVLSPIEAPKLGRSPYQPVVPWGQTAYFNLDVQMLKRMASSQKIELDFKAAGGAAVRFTAGGDARETLVRYLHWRGY